MTTRIHSPHCFICFELMRMMSLVEFIRLETLHSYANEKKVRSMLCLNWIRTYIHFHFPIRFTSTEPKCRFLYFKNIITLGKIFFVLVVFLGEKCDIIRRRFVTSTTRFEIDSFQDCLCIVMHFELCKYQPTHIIWFVHSYYDRSTSHSKAGKYFKFK